MIYVCEIPYLDGVLQYTEIKAWATESCIGEYSLTKSFRCIEFCSKEDAVAYKLRWL